MNAIFNKKLYYVKTLFLPGFMLLLSFCSSTRDHDRSSLEHPVVLDPSSQAWLEGLEIREEKNWGRENFSYVYDDERDKEVLQLAFPKGSASPNVSKIYGAPVGGGEFLAETGAFDRLRLAYYVKFEEGFDFNKGGKLPGLFGGTANSGGEIPTGYDGFSTRFMWREGGKGELYLYLPDSQQWGTAVGAGAWNFQAGKWHKLEHLIALNDPDKYNGRVKIWVDDQLVFTQDSLLFRKTPELKINGLFFSTFFGGNDTTWSATRHENIWFDKFVMDEYVD